MPPVTLHCMVHLMSPEALEKRFPAVYAIRFSPPSSKEHYTLSAMMIWATVPYAVWQLSYHFLITVRRREKIAAGRPTSFTWLRKSYSNTFIGRFVLNLPASLQEPAFMLIQYSYAIMTMLPCPLWFWSRWASAAFLLCVFTWSVYNGATYYIDVFGKRFQNELEQLRKDVAKWQNSPDPTSPLMTPRVEGVSQLVATLLDQQVPQESEHTRSKSIDKIPPLESDAPTATGIERATSESTAKVRKAA
jgi:hypothetical protein